MEQNSDHNIMHPKMAFDQSIPSRNDLWSDPQTEVISDLTKIRLFPGPYNFGLKTQHVCPTWVWS